MPVGVWTSTSARIIREPKSWSMSPRDSAKPPCASQKNEFRATSVTASYSGKTAQASLTVTAGALDHITISPISTSITAGGSQAYTVTAFDAVHHKVMAKAITDIEVRSGATDTAGGLLFTALQDGWLVAYNDETLEVLWRFNVGTPLKGAPVTYAIGPKQYVAVQSSGRHEHPVKFDNLESSSYLFVFALN